MHTSTAIETLAPACDIKMRIFIRAYQLQIDPTTDCFYFFLFLWPVSAFFCLDCVCECVPIGMMANIKFMNQSFFSPLILKTFENKRKYHTHLWIPEIAHEISQLQFYDTEIDFLQSCWCLMRLKSYNWS